METRDVIVRQGGSRSEITVGERSIFFEVSGIPDFTFPQPNYVVWGVLPFAMREGVSLKFRFAVDPVVLANARELTRLWASWWPEVYSPIEIDADEEAIPAPADASRSVILFSGGVDSTFAMLRQLEADDPARPLTHALTVHGMNYRYDNNDDLAELFDKTQPLIDRENLHRIVVRTNLGSELGRLGMTHAFLLSSSLFLVSNHFDRGYIAADITAAQDFLAFPWGTNHISNALFVGSHFKMDTLSLDTTRIWKLDYLQRDQVSMNAISFCGDKRKQPFNCGECLKCLRTKTMFMALNGTCPEIFLTPGVTRRQIDNLDVSSNVAFKHYFEVLEVARKRGTLNSLPGLEEKIDAGISRRRRKYRRQRLMEQVRYAASKWIR